VFTEDPELKFCLPEEAEQQEDTECNCSLGLEQAQHGGNQLRV